MCIVVTKSGAGKPKCSGENIHLLYTDSTVANRNLLSFHIDEKMPGFDKAKRDETDAQHTTKL